ncbi:MAG: hypothetical protein DDT31_00389 [Syntrophomonadaceae bacterium]|nr:hypothetical protein [Bacillota bacterium]
MSRFHYWSMVGSNVWLAILAGYLNAFSTVALLFERSAHMSGRATDLGRGFMAFFVLTDAAARTRLFEEAVIILIITASFLAGAILGAKLMRTIGLGKTIMMIGVFIGVSSIMVLIGLPSGVINVFSLERSLWAILLCIPMGMQNAATSVTSMGRSTHVTGTLTDLGISIAEGTYKKTIHLSCRWGGFVGGSGIGLGIFLAVPSLSTQLLILALCALLTGAFFAHPAVRRKLGTVLQFQEPLATAI